MVVLVDQQGQAKLAMVVLVVVVAVSVENVVPMVRVVVVDILEEQVKVQTFMAVVAAVHTIQV